MKSKQINSPQGQFYVNSSNTLKIQKLKQINKQISLLKTNQIIKINQKQDFKEQNPKSRKTFIKPALQIQINERSKTESSIYDEVARKQNLSKLQPFCFSPSVKSENQIKIEGFQHYLSLQKGSSLTNIIRKPNQLQQGYKLKVNSPVKSEESFDICNDQKNQIKTKVQLKEILQKIKTMMNVWKQKEKKYLENQLYLKIQIDNLTKQLNKELRKDS